MAIELKPRYLVFVSNTDNHNKYYKQIPNGDGTWTAEYGRVGSKPQKRVYSSNQYDLKYKEKLAKGYVDKTHLMTDLIEKVEPKTNNDYKKIEDEAIAEIVQRLQDLAKKAISDNYTVKAEAVTQAMVDNAQDLLKDRTQGRIAAIQDPSGAMGKVMKGIGAAFTVKSAVDKYKESRAEGRSVVSSAVRAGASAAAADMLGPWGSMALGIMQAAPGAVIGATSFVASEYRRMNSAANFTPLGGTSFQDSQQLATMRQSGMELAKMSQYNLEQTLMGAEAKHLHR
jgi:hypothetical protein